MLLKDLARALGISPSMCGRLAKRGMPVDVERARRWRRRHLALARTKGARMAGPQASAPSAAGEGTAPDDDEPNADESSAEYREARARREQLRVEREQLELERMRGGVIDALQAAEDGFTCFRMVRDYFENIAPRVAAQVHGIAASGGGVDEVERVIGAEIRQALTHGANAIDRLARGRSGDDDDE